MKKYIFLVVITAVISVFSQDIMNQNLVKLNDLKQQVESGNVSQSDAIKEAKSLGLTDSQIEQAKKEAGLGESNFDLMEGEAVSKDLNLPVKKENLQEVDELTTDEEDADEEIIEDKDSLGIDREKYFGYSIFNKRKTKFSLDDSGPVDPEYKVGPDDEVVISVWGETELRYTKTVSKEGTIFIDKVGQLIVNGLTIDKLQKKLTRVMSRFYSSLKPQNGKGATTFLDVTLGKLKPIKIFFVGEISKPGAYKINSFSTAFSALYTVGGPTLKGTMRDIHVVRDGEVIAKVDMYDYLLTGKNNSDIRLQNDDTIFIGSRKSTVILEGEVTTPSIFELKENEGLRELIKFAGGFVATADLSRVQVERIEPFSNRTDSDISVKVDDFELIEGFKGNKPIIKDIKLNDKDVVRIFSLLDSAIDYVEVEGAVYRAGRYDLEENMTLSRVIEKAQGYLPDVYMKKAELIRTHPEGYTEFINIDLTKENAGDLKLKELDKIKVYSIWEIENKEYVLIKGHIKRPGKYILHDSLKISDLIFKAGSLNNIYFWKNTYQKRADLIRYNDDQLTTRIIPIELDKLINGDKDSDMVMKHRDELIIYDKSVTFEEKNIEIKGEVKKPGEYKLSVGMGIHDLILRANGFKKSAYRYNVEVYRVDPYKVTDDSLAAAYVVEIDPSLLNYTDISNDFELQDHDLVIVRVHPNYQYQRNVMLEGEVKFAGTYTLLRKNETLKEIIERSGSFTTEAFIPGIRLFRGGEQVVSDFRELFDSKEDIILKSGDRIVIPKRPGTVKVEGFVNSPGYVKFRDGWSVDQYIEAVGSFRPDGEVDKVLVYYPGGAAKEDGWSSPDVEEGCKIVVVKAPEEKEIDWVEVYKQWASILASTLTIVFLISKN